MCVGVLVWLGWSGIRVAGWSTTLAILFHFLCAQHVSDINISIIRSLRLFCWITTLVFVLGSMCFGFSVWLGWSGILVAGWSLQNGYHSNLHTIAVTPCTHTSQPPWHLRDLVPTSPPTSPQFTVHNKSRITDYLVFHVQPEDVHCQAPKHVVVRYVVNCKCSSTFK